MIYYIYKINFLCGEPGRYYIGKHCATSEHKAQVYTGSGKFCKYYFKKYGKENTYTKDILAYASNPDELLELEKKFVGDLYKTDSYCMNFTSGGKGDNRNNSFLCKESRDKMSAAHKGKQLTEEHRLKISKAMTNKTHTIEEKEKISIAMMGKQSPTKGKHRIYDVFGKMHYVN